MEFVNTSILAPEQRIALLEKENAALKLQLEKRQNIEYETERWERLGNYAVYLKAVVSEIPNQFQRSEHADKKLIETTFKDFFEMTGLLTALMLFDKMEKQQKECNIHTSPNHSNEKIHGDSDNGAKKRSELIGAGDSNPYTCLSK